MRIEKVRQLWYRLKTGETRTFASYWAEGTVERVLGKACFPKNKSGLWMGIAPSRSITEPIEKSRQT